VYGPDVETLVQEEDAQPLTEPIIAPIRTKRVYFRERSDVPRTTFDWEFLTDLMDSPKLIRCLAVAGHLHHGKTCLLDCLVELTHPDVRATASDVADGRAELAFTHSLRVECERGLSVKCCPLSLLLPDSRGKSHLVNLMDTPGHPCFADEQAAAYRLCDAVLLVLKLPPADAYHRLRHLVDEINALVHTHAPTPELARPLTPLDGSVIFRFVCISVCFSLASFASLYKQKFAPRMDAGQFAERLWGDVYFDAKTRRFSRNPNSAAGARASRHSRGPLFSSVWSPSISPAHVQTVARASVLARFSQAEEPLVEAAVRELSEPRLIAAARACPALVSSGAENRTRWRACALTWPPCEPTCAGSRPGEQYTLADRRTPSQPRSSRAVCGCSTLNTGVELEGAGCQPATGAGLKACDEPIARPATSRRGRRPAAGWLTSGRCMYNTPPLMKVAVEPSLPIRNSLPKWLDGPAQGLSKSYSHCRHEESGEHVIMGTRRAPGLRLLDLRQLYADIEPDPVLSAFGPKHVVETKARLKCFAETPNRRNKLEPLHRQNPWKRASPKTLLGGVSLSWPRNGWLNSFPGTNTTGILWLLGPSGHSVPTPAAPTSSLTTPCPPRWTRPAGHGTRLHLGHQGGPLCEEPVRNVKMKMLDALIAPEPVHRGGSQLIPTARRVAYSAFLMATPRLMEPYLFVEALTPADCVSAVYSVLARRRGHVTHDAPVPGSPLYVVKAFLPAIDSFGFETDLRTHTQGQAFCLSVFHHWQIVPGDPLDKSIVIRPLEPQPAVHLAREFMIKTRRRKGLSEDVAINKFFDDPMLLELAKQDVGLSGLA
uniref:EFG_C domain-containing protein n=1 Tax=Macrostomum lignano TaxID=282301 RepID=A0A1I8F3R1_9PLAT